MANWFKKIGDAWDRYVGGNGVTGFASTNSAIQFFSYGGEIQWQRFEAYADFHSILHKASPVAAVFNKRANMFANGCVETLNRTTQKYVRGANKDWEKLIERPNPIQSKTAFLKQLHLYLDIFGWAYAMPIKPVGFNTPTKLFLLPPWMLTIERVKKNLITLTDSDTIRKVYLDWDGQRTELQEKDLILFTDTTSLICEDTLLPEGRMRQLAYSVTNVRSSYEALATLIQNKGPMAIISSGQKDAIGNIAWSPDEKSQVQQDFQRAYGLTRGQSQYIISNAVLTYQAMSWDVKQMGIFETLEIAKMDICDVYNFPYELMSAAKGNTFANKEEAKKSAYQDATIPESKSIMEQLNAGLKTELYNIEYVISYADVEVLQVSEKTKAEAKSATLDALRKEWELGLITRNMALQAVGRDVITDPALADEFNKYKFVEDAEIADKQAKNVEK